MSKTHTLLDYLLDWLLVLAIMLAPVQGAFSAIDNACEYNHKVATEDTHHSASLDLTCDDSKTSPAQDCCIQNSDGGECAGVCNALHVSTYLPPSSWNIPGDNHQTYAPQLATFYIGRSVPILLRPPPVVV